MDIKINTNFIVGATEERAGRPASRLFTTRARPGLAQTRARAHSNALRRVNALI